MFVWKSSGGGWLIEWVAENIHKYVGQSPRDNKQNERHSSFHMHLHSKKNYYYECDVMMDSHENAWQLLTYRQYRVLNSNKMDRGVIYMWKMKLQFKFPNRRKLKIINLIYALTNSRKESTAGAEEN